MIPRKIEQISLFSEALPVPDLTTYNKILVAFSGGKDSLACLLHLLELGIDKTKIELWHHDVDGREGSSLMDWPVTKDYCQAIATAFQIPIYFSWLEGGFEREMLRQNQAKARSLWQNPDGSIGHAGGIGQLGTRRRFPQVSADLSTRWCSAYLKIDVCAAAIRGQTRFNNARTLIVTGERAEESPSRARYNVLEAHKTHLGPKRHVDQWRPIHRWPESKVWDIIERWKIAPHPAYKLGWSRVSCAACIFGSDRQWASLKQVNPVQFERISEYEKSLNTTIRRTKSIAESLTSPFYSAISPDLITLATSNKYNGPVFDFKWQLPAGAFGEDKAGPI